MDHLCCFPSLKTCKAWPVLNDRTCKNYFVLVWCWSDQISDQIFPSLISLFYGEVSRSKLFLNIMWFWMILESEVELLLTEHCMLLKLLFVELLKIWVGFDFSWPIKPDRFMGFGVHYYWGVGSEPCSVEWLFSPLRSCPLLICISFNVAELIRTASVQRWKIPFMLVTGFWKSMERQSGMYL